MTDWTIVSAATKRTAMIEIARVSIPSLFSQNGVTMHVDSCFRHTTNHVATLCKSSHMYKRAYKEPESYDHVDFQGNIEWLS